MPMGGMMNGIMGSGLSVGIGMWISLLINTLILVAMIVGVVWLVHRVVSGGERGTHPQASEDPLDILKKRYARGKLTQQEFEKMKEDIQRQ